MRTEPDGRVVVDATGMTRPDADKLRGHRFPAGTRILVKGRADCAPRVFDYLRRDILRPLLIGVQDGRIDFED